MKYQFIERHRSKYPVVTMCRVLEVTRGGLLCLACPPAGAVIGGVVLLITVWFMGQQKWE